LVRPETFGPYYVLSLKVSDNFYDVSDDKDNKNNIEL
jgi:hypothetical protein